MQTLNNVLHKKIPAESALRRVTTNHYKNSNNIQIKLEYTEFPKRKKDPNTNHYFIFEINIDRENEKHSINIFHDKYEKYPSEIHGPHLFYTCEPDNIIELYSELERFIDDTFNKDHDTLPNDWEFSTAKELADNFERLSIPTTDVIDRIIIHQITENTYHTHQYHSINGYVVIEIDYNTQVNDDEDEIYTNITRHCAMFPDASPDDLLTLEYASVPSH